MPSQAVESTYRMRWRVPQNVTPGAENLPGEEGVLQIDSVTAFAAE
jgi:hypothetical protein